MATPASIHPIPASGRPGLALRRANEDFIDPTRRDPAKHTFVAHVVSFEPRVVPMLSAHKAFLVVPSTAAT
jgi:hypothetical protein